MSRVTHYRSTPTGYTACSKDSPRLIVTDVEADVTCGHCIRTFGPQRVGVHRGRTQFELRCKGGPWDGQKAVFPQQESGGLSLHIKVGTFVGRYNLNSGIWEDDK